MPGRIRTGWRALVGISASAVLLAVYARSDIGFVLGFAALVPWLCVLDDAKTLAGATWRGWAMCIAFVAGVFAWFGSAFAEYVGLSPILGIAALLVAAPVLQPQFIVFAVVRYLARHRPSATLSALTGAAAWVATELLVPKLLGDTLGHGLYPSRVLRQIADVGGAAGITFLLIVANECLAAAISRRASTAALRTPLIVASSIVILMVLYGSVRLQLLATTDAAEKPVRIGMAQSGIVDYERLRRESGTYAVVRHVLDTHYALSRDALQKQQVDALLWSETVYPTTFAHPKSDDGAALDREILDFVRTSGVPLVFGTYDSDANGEYNAAAFVERDGSTLGFYRKTDLFPLTERVPPWLDGPSLRRWLPWTGTWQPGDGARVFPLRLADGREIPVQTLICRDDVDPALAIDAARLGAQILLGLSNDSWFSADPLGARLHLAVAAFRSIETRLPQLRVTTNGLSAVIDPSGEIVARTQMNEQEFLVGEVRPQAPRFSLMRAWGDWVGRAGLAFLLLSAGVSLVRRIWRVQGTTAPLSAAATEMDVSLLSPFWRGAGAALHGLARTSLIWLGAMLFAGDSVQNNPLALMRLFAALVLAPELAAWAIVRAGLARAHLESEVLVLEQRDRSIEIRIADIAAVEPWTMPLPNCGMWLRLASGRRWSHGIAMDDPATMIRALLQAGAPSGFAQALRSRAIGYADARAASTHRWFDHPLLKFIAFPLLIALPAFRLHQHIAYGGTFGEYYAFGLAAYLSTLAIWWATWAIDLLIYAAVLRASIETGTLLAMALHPQSTSGIRKALTLIGRVLYYLVVPAWFLMRSLS